jgi:FtsP/CotA-like multicopper oxidase with cupredoxin domain
VIVEPDSARAFTIFAQVEDRSGFVSGMLAPRMGMAPPVPAMDPRPMRTMADMGIGGMDHSAMSGMSGIEPPGAIAPGVAVDNVATMPASRLAEPGGGLEGNGRRVLTYADLRAERPGDDARAPSREIVLHLTGNMQRFIWGFDGKTFSEAEPIDLKRGERVRFTLINDTMMEHPMHLHGLWSELYNGQDTHRPYKHTIVAKPGERLSFLVTADVPGRWGFHCHLLYHMELGMFREVHVS